MNNIHCKLFMIPPLLSFCHSDKKATIDGYGVKVVMI